MLSPCPLDWKFFENFYKKPWLVWLSGLSASLGTKESLVQFPVRTHSWVVGQVPRCGVRKRQPHIDVSLSLFPSPLPPV